MTKNSACGQGAAHQSDCSGSHARQVLLVDDESMVLAVGRAILERQGFKVLTAGGGEEALHILAGQSECIALVILDMIMPEMDGLAALDRIRELAPEMPVILSSGYALNHQAETLMRKGCNGFIQKPFNIAGLSRAVREALGTIG